MFKHTVNNTRFISRAMRDRKVSNSQEHIRTSIVSRGKNHPHDPFKTSFAQVKMNI